MKKYVFGFDEGNRNDSALLGIKGANLAQMTAMGLSVPYGFNISTEGCIYLNKCEGIFGTSFIEQILRGLKNMEKTTGRTYGDPNNPLLVSVRSGAALEMRGLLKTVLNVGINDEIASAMSKNSEREPFAFECYVTFIKQFATYVKGLDPKLFEEIELRNRRELSGRPETEILHKIILQYKKLYKKETKQEFPQDVATQLFETILASLSSFNSEQAKSYRRLNNISNDLGSACTVQAMVYGNLNLKSGMGVVHTRNPLNGSREITGDFARNTQDKKVLVGRPTLEIGELLEKNRALKIELENTCRALEKLFLNCMDIEICIQNGKLYIMQAEYSKLSPVAQLKIAVDMVGQRIISREQALLNLNAPELKRVLEPKFDTARTQYSKILAKGICGETGCATGYLALSPSVALSLASEGKPVIMVVKSISPQDAKSIYVCAGLITTTGGRNCHASVLARSKSVPCITGCKHLTINEQNLTIKMSGIVFREGEQISMDATNGNVYGEAITLEQVKKDADLERILEWARNYASVDIYTDADTPGQVDRGLGFGAEGVGLCRTENMFFTADRIDLIREFLLVEKEEKRQNILRSLLKAHTFDLVKVIEKVGEREINIRLLDPVLNKFLPSSQNTQRILARELGMSYEEMREKISALQQTNPALGLRGCRLQVIYPQLISIQTEAIFRAMSEVKKKKGVMPKLKIMVPMVSIIPELELHASIINETAKNFNNNKINIPYKLGCMVETPRACMIAGRLAEYVDFMAFGSNDLTQLTFGYSRDDCMDFLRKYYADSMIFSNPFATLDPKGVFSLIELAVNSAREVKPNMEFMLLGDVASDYRSLALAKSVGITKASCEQRKVPSAIIANAQSKLKERDD